MLVQFVNTTDRLKRRQRKILNKATGGEDVVKNVMLLLVTYQLILACNGLPLCKPGNASSDVKRNKNWHIDR